MDSLKLILLGLLLAPSALWAVCIFVLRLCGVAHWSLLLSPPLWGVVAGSVGAFLGFYFSPILHGTGAIEPLPQALYYGLIATFLGALAGCVRASIHRQRGP